MTSLSSLSHRHFETKQLFVTNQSIQSIYLANCATTKKWMSTKQCKAQWRATRKATKGYQGVAFGPAMMEVCSRQIWCSLLRPSEE